MMKFDIRRTLFTMSGLAAIMLIMLFARTYNVHASVKAGEKFGDWVTVCEKNDKNKQVCLLTQVVTTPDPKDSKKSQHIATFKIGYFGPTKTLKMLQILPFGVNLQSGTSIIIEKEKLIAPAKFSTCEAIGCMAVSELTKADIESLTNSNKAYVGLITIEGKQVNINLSTKNLKEGLTALNK